jgi:peptidoglycan hydrolase-like protein with peptidoglycan-binding domain
VTNYAAKDYGSNPHAGKNNNAGRAKWGGGWPNCSGAKAVAVSPSGARVTVRKQLVELVETLFEITHLEGYKVRKSDTGGFNCRPIAGTRTPSNHSYGIAVDINWSSNPYSLRFKSDIPPAVVNAWETAGFYWGGRYRVRKDTMHFEYLGGPGDVQKHLAIACKRLASLKGEPTPKPPAPKPPTTPKPSTGRKLGSRTLKRGNTGADVAVLQRFLGIKDDGIFGPATEATVKAYQRKRHITADGIAGKVTLGPIVKIVYGGK